MHAVRQRGDRRASATLAVGEDLVEGALEAATPRKPLEPPGADLVRGELRAKVRATLIGLAHSRDERIDRRALERLRRDEHSLLGERPAVGRHRAGRRAADVGMVGARRGEADQPRAGIRRGHDGDVWQVRAAAEGVVEDPASSGRLRVLANRRYGVGHRAEVHGDMLRLHDHLAARVEQRARRIAPLLDVRRVRGPYEQRTHLIAGRAQPADDEAQLDRIEAAAHDRVSSIVPSARTRPRQPGVIRSVASGSAQIAGPSTRSPGAGAPMTTVASSSAPR